MKTAIKLLILTATIQSAALATTDESLQQALVNCQQISDNQSRLKCFDDIQTSSATKLNENPTVMTESTNQFPVLIADLDESNLAISFGQLDFLGETKSAVLVSAGIRHGIRDFTWGNGQSLAFNVFGQIRSQFDVEQIDTRNNRGGALINTDFSVGGELVKSMDHWNWRFSYTHRSTHLGDEFLIDNPIYLTERINLSYETVKWTAHKNINNFDFYAGVAYITRSEPSSLDKTMYQLGTQYQGDHWHGIKPIWAIDLKSWGEYDSKINVNLRAGIEIDQWTKHPFQLLFEYQEGQSPYGQFYTEDSTYTGLTFLQNW